ncbi:hypothetical protein RUM44_002799 [Polyplax serrata]|uniref:LAGLIDADG homing endonuclease n=1 Tax=Polyplax serrata TaxID=468196 RepID=A0ABR1AFR3_POLSC
MQRNQRLHEDVSSIVSCIKNNRLKGNSLVGVINERNGKHYQFTLSKKTLGMFGKDGTHANTGPMKKHKEKLTIYVSTFGTYDVKVTVSSGSERPNPNCTGLNLDVTFGGTIITNADEILTRVANFISCKTILLRTLTDGRT